MYTHVLPASSIKKNTSISVAVKTDRMRERRQEKEEGWVREEMRVATVSGYYSLSLSSLLRARMKDSFCEGVTRENLALLDFDNEMCKTI